MSSAPTPVTPATGGAHDAHGAARTGRIAWLVVLGLLAVLRRFAWLGTALRQPRTLALFGTSALLLGCNWLLYVWAVNGGRVLDAGLEGRNYRVRWAAADGRRIDFIVDAETGQIISGG